MQPGNAPALHAQLEDFASHSCLPVEIGDDEVEIHHCQYAKYPVARAARVIHDAVDIDPSGYDDRESFTDALLDVSETAQEAVEDATGLTVGAGREHLFDDGAFIDSVDLYGQVTRLVKLYEGFEAPEGQERAYERYGEQHRLPTSRACVVADLLTLYNVRLAERHISRLRRHIHDESWTRSEAEIALYAMRDLVEKEHGWSVFDMPDPDAETVAELWQMAEEVGFDPGVRWAYALFILPHGAKFYEPGDAVRRNLRHGMGETMARMAGSGHQDERWTSEDTSDKELEAHREEMRDTS